jgi:hypothetical protein
MASVVVDSSNNRPESITKSSKINNDDNLAQVAVLLSNFQSSLDNDQILQFIEIFRSLAYGLHPTTAKDVDELTRTLWKKTPASWPKDLTRKLKDTLNKIRKMFDLHPLRDTHMMLIILLVLLILLLALGYFYFFKVNNKYTVGQL